MNLKALASSVVIVLFAQIAPPDLAATSFLQGSPNCEVALKIRQRVQENLGYQPVMRVRSFSPLTSSKTAFGYRITAVHGENGTDVAFIDYVVYDHGRSIHLLRLQVLNDNNKAKGLSNALFAEMLEHELGARRIIAELSEDNLRIMEKELRPVRDVNKAFRATPIFKTASHFGFTKFRLAADFSLHIYSAIMELETPH